QAMLATSWELEEERGGNRMIDLWNVYGQIYGPLDYEIDFRAHTYADFYYLGEKYSYRHYHMENSFRPTGSLLLYFNHTLGDIVDYDNARQAKILTLGPGFELLVGRKLSLGYEHAWERLTVMGGRELYTANVGRFRLKYQFDRRMFLRANVQYVRVDRDTGLYLSDYNDMDEQVMSQFLFAYTINPQTVLYMGYSDNFYGADTGGPDPSLIGLTQTDRTFFMKIGYAWVL
ncbi:MAG TPA: hypothetical protein VLA34_05875, partial [Candidatus Krumholzibacterium sp.]|nr:hypothetical protein [Candidatus Krumholzibacterium sp.]